MSSSWDAGYYADQFYKAQQEKCKLAPPGSDGKHDFKVVQKNWWQCQYCKEDQYTK